MSIFDKLNELAQKAGDWVKNNPDVMEAMQAAGGGAPRKKSKNGARIKALEERAEALEHALTETKEAQATEQEEIKAKLADLQAEIRELDESMVTLFKRQQRLRVALLVGGILAFVGIAVALALIVLLFNRMGTPCPIQ